MQNAWLSRVAVLALLFSVPVVAQETAEASGGTPADQPAAIVVPGGTRLSLILTHPMRSKRLRRGDSIYALITSPVTAGTDVAFPAGTYLRGRLQRWRQRDSRGQLHLESLTLTFPNGYVVSISGPMSMTSADGYLLKDPGTGRTATALLLPAAGAGLGAVVGHGASSGEPSRSCEGFGPECARESSAFSRGRSTAIGAVVGMAAGGIGSLIVLARSPGFFLDAGTPLEAVLDQPLSLDRERVADAVANSRTHIIHPPVPLLHGPAVGPPLWPREDRSGCTGTQVWCNGRCVETTGFSLDSSNCGYCGHSCPADETCTGGSCRKIFY